MTLIKRVVVGTSATSGNTVPSSASGVYMPRPLRRERSRIDTRPFSFVDATIGRPERVIANVGGLSASQS